MDKKPPRKGAAAWRAGLPSRNTLLSPPPFSRRVLLLLASAALLAGPCLGAAYRATNAANLLDFTGKLKAGDTLVVAKGNYDVTSWSLSGLRGTADKWIVLKGEAGAAIRSTSGCCNLVQIADAAYLRLQGLELTMAAANPDIDGINISGGYTHHIRFEGLRIHHMTGNGISIFADSAAHIELVGSELAHMAGSGLYWGYPGRDLVHDVLIEGNYIHHCPADPGEPQNYGIQFKGWGYRARILGNVLHDVGGTTRSGLIVYYGRKPLAGDRPEDVNVVAGNVLWNCRNEGITVMSDALVENNIVFDAAVGINLQTYGDESFTGTSFVENLKVRNNTAFRCSEACISVSGWGAAGAGVSFTGNAAYQATATAAAVSGSTGKGHSAGNVGFGAGTLAGLVKGRGLADFLAVSAAGLFSGLDFYPAAGSPLKDALDAGEYCAAEDFNGTRRPQGDKCDAGAYELAAAVNPGWRIREGFKAGGVGTRSLDPASPKNRRGGTILRLREGTLQLVDRSVPGVSDFFPIRLDGRACGIPGAGIAELLLSY